MSTPTPKILTLDIETSPNQVWAYSLFKPIIGIDQIIEPSRMLSWAAKWFGKDKVYYASEFHDGTDVMRQKLFDLMSEADYYGTWNGKSFDLPHIQREFLNGGLGAIPPAGHVDGLKVARKALYLPSYKLDYVAQYLGVGEKIPVTFQLHKRVLAGDPAAWRLFKRYNIRDVLITEEVIFDKLMPYVTLANTGLFNGQLFLCSNPLCRSADLERRGFYRTGLSVWQRYRCRDCGRWSRERKSTTNVDLRGVVA